MYIFEVLDRVDELYPNSYPTEQKLSWCYDVSCAIRREIKKLYRTYHVDHYPGFMPLPPDVDFTDIISVHVNGRRLEKVDERTFSEGSIRRGDSVKVVYRLMPQAYSLSCEAVIKSPDDTVREESDQYVSFEKLSGVAQYRLSFPKRYMYILVKVREGDTFTLVHEEEKIRARVISIPPYDEAEDKTHLVIELTADGTGPQPTLGAQEGVLNRGGVIFTVPTEIKTECAAPYDSMYLDYVMGKIAYYQNDLGDYNKFVTLYNKKLDEYAKAYKETRPNGATKNFNHYW